MARLGFYGPQFLWPHAPPGGGKTVQSFFVVDHLIERRAKCAYSSLDATPSDLLCSPIGLLFATSDIRVTIKTYDFAQMTPIYELTSDIDIINVWDSSAPSLAQGIFDQAARLLRPFRRLMQMKTCLAFATDGPF